MGVGVQPVQRAHPREGDVAEDVLGEQRWAEREDQMRREHPSDEPGDRQPLRSGEHQQVGRAEHEHQGLEPAAAEVRADPAERPGEPSRPAAAVRGDVARRGLRRVEGEHEQRGEQREQARTARNAGGETRGGGVASLRSGGERGWPGGLHKAILTAIRASGVHWALYAVSRRRGRPAIRACPHTL